MVVIHVKRTEADQFLVETTVTESNDALIRRLVSVGVVPAPGSASAALPAAPRGAGLSLRAKCRTNAVRGAARALPLGPRRFVFGTAAFCCFALPTPRNSSRSTALPRWRRSAAWTT